jgi:hypothetical protein
MKYKFFKKVKNLPVRDLLSELNRMLEEKKIDWEKRDYQICINSIVGQENNIHLGTGSLEWDWQNGEEIFDDQGNTVKFIPKKYDNPMQESDFTVLCTAFKDTVFEEIYDAVSKKYKIGRMRLMLMRPKTCLTWHNDGDTRLHYPIDTNRGCQMVIENEVMHMPRYTWWHTNTSYLHTAFNASRVPRIHLVTSIIGEYDS